MSTWKILPSTQVLGRSYSRPLDGNETSFYWDRVFNGTADVVWHYTVQVKGPRGKDLFHQDHVRRAWISLKQRHPLLGSRTELQDGTDVANCIVSEKRLAQLFPGEVIFCDISSAEEVSRLVERTMLKPPVLLAHLPARIIIFRLADEPSIFHVLFHVAHLITDATSGATIARTFFELLSLPPVEHVPDLEERLAMVVSSADLNPTLQLSKARQRWRRAAAKVIYSIRQSKLQGGHTVPRKVTSSTYRTPAIRRSTGCEFTPAESALILENCRRHKVTFGAAIPVISQMAITRILHRRYFRGEISEEEWEQRRRQPMHFGGPLTLRPYLDPKWVKNGGALEVCVSINYYDCTLPFMPTPYGSRRDLTLELVDGAPSFASLLSHGRFLHRCRMSRSQIVNILKNPLFLDIAEARTLTYVARKKTNALHWLDTLNGRPIRGNIPPLISRIGDGPIPCNGLTSVGQYDLVMPNDYPLPASHPLSLRSTHSQRTKTAVTASAQDSFLVAGTPPTPQSASDVPPENEILLHLLSSETNLHARPTEFLLGSLTHHGQLSLGLTYDGNVYDDEVAREFVRECREAALWYLGGKAESKGKL